MVKAQTQPHRCQGSIREAGGAFAKMGVAKEEQYFHNLQMELLSKLKKKEVSKEEFENYHNERIKAHESQLDRHKKELKKLKEPGDV